MGSIFSRISVRVGELLCPFRICRGSRWSMTSRVFGLRAANCPACNNWPQHSRFTAIECFAAASTALTPVSAGSAETLSHDDPDARRPRFAFHDLGALCRGCVPAPRGMRSFVAVQGECRYGPNRGERAGGNGGP